MTKEELIARARHRVEQKSQERHFSDEIVLNMKRGYESKIKDLETQIEKMKSCSNCKHYAKEYELCYYSLGDEDYNCRGRKWEIKEKMRGYVIGFIVGVVITTFSVIMVFV